MWVDNKIFNKQALAKEYERLSGNAASTFYKKSGKKPVRNWTAADLKVLERMRKKIVKDLS